MIRTHKPRGFAWVCPSAFQQTPHIRHISYEDSEAVYTEDDILCDDGKEYTLDERAAKRRRVEQIADDYLNGHLPDIHSARPTELAIEDAIAGLFTLPKVGRHAFQLGKQDFVSCKDDDVCGDAEDDGEILRAFIVSQQPQTNDHAQAMLKAFETVPEEIVTQVKAQASCGRTRRLKFAAISRDPSEEALREAAELRKRRSRTSVAMSQIVSQPQSCPRPVISETQTACSFGSTSDETASDCGPSPTSAWTSSKWLRSGAFERRRKAVTEDCSRDELGASSLFSPSQRACSTVHPSLTLASFQSIPASTGTVEPGKSFQSASATNQSFPGLPCQEAGPSADTLHPQTFAASMYQTASDGPGALMDLPCQADDRQTRLYRSQGIRAVAPKSWFTVNEGSEQRDSVTIGGSSVSESHSLENDLARVPQDHRQRTGALRARYSALQDNGDSPFMFRKKASAINYSGGPDTEPMPQQRAEASKTPRRRTEPPLSGAPGMSKLDPTGAVTVVAADQAVLHPETPLVSEYLNNILPKCASTGRYSSSLRKSLREELIASGAEILCCAGDASSQTHAEQSRTEPTVVANSLQEDTEDHDTSLRHAVVESQPKQPWVGTQQLLVQAHHDLFTSPDKTNSALYFGDKMTPTAQVVRTSRRPLQSLSQDRVPIPSTQALLEDWPGWSTIKKPRSDGKHPSLYQSPSMGNGTMPMISSDPTQLHRSIDARRSTLRYSISFDKSSRPVTVGAAVDDVTGTDVALTETRNTTDESSFNTAIEPRSPSGKIASFSSFDISSINLPIDTEFKGDDINDESLDPFGTHELTASCQAGQRASMNSQDLFETMIELERDVLGSTRKDMGPVFGDTATFSSF